VSGRGYMLRSARGDWRTPPEIVALVRDVFGGTIDLDPCSPAVPEQMIAATNYSGGGLDPGWTGRVYVNPPFGALADWTAKAAREARQGAEIVFLLPARTDTAYWHEHVATAQAVCFLRGRLRFVGAPAACPFPTALAYWGPRPWEFHRVFSPRGMVVVPSAPRVPEHGGKGAA
jgi:DNA N-6-adenine-methyltransferase (Dam)